MKNKMSHLRALAVLFWQSISHSQTFSSNCNQGHPANITLHRKPPTGLGWALLGFGGSPGMIFTVPRGSENQRLCLTKTMVKLHSQFRVFILLPIFVISSFTNSRFFFPGVEWAVLGMQDIKMFLNGRQSHVGRGVRLATALCSSRVLRAGWDLLNGMAELLKAVFSAGHRELEWPCLEVQTLLCCRAQPQEGEGRAGLCPCPGAQPGSGSPQPWTATAAGVSTWRERSDWSCHLHQQLLTSPRTFYRNLAFWYGCLFNNGQFCINWVHEKWGVLCQISQHLFNFNSRESIFNLPQWSGH